VTITNGFTSAGVIFSPIVPFGSGPGTGFTTIDTITRNRNNFDVPYRIARLTAAVFPMPASAPPLST